MTLSNQAYLVVEDDTQEAVFEFHAELEITSDLDKAFIMSERGQYIREIFNQANIISDVDSVANRRAGYHIDGGAGSWQTTIDFEVQTENNVSWGDGSGGSGGSNVTKLDASGTGVDAVTRENIFELWMARSITDSRNPGRLHFGEWTDGRFNESGVFGQPMPVAVTGHNVSTDTGEPGNLSGTVDVQVIALFPDTGPPSWLANSTIGSFVESAAEALGVIPD